jgi:NADH:ubiquinone oxidoreductase subunit 5 (subunit L)/multisubunit Na+/H+ antiporter MnhA subunit
MLLNRVGDFFIISAILLIFVVCKSVDFYVVFSQISYHSAKCFNFYGYTFSLVDFICFLLFLGAITKSAQIGFHG